MYITGAGKHQTKTEDDLDNQANKEKHPALIEQPEAEQSLSAASPGLHSCVEVASNKH